MYNPSTVKNVLQLFLLPSKIFLVFFFFFWATTLKTISLSFLFGDPIYWVSTENTV